MGRRKRIYVSIGLIFWLIVAVILVLSVSWSAVM